MVRTDMRAWALALAAGGVFGAAGACRAGVPIDAAWLNAADGLWGVAANWDINQVPNNMGMTEYNAFLTVGGAAYTVDLDLAVAVNDLTIDSALGEATLRLNGFSFNVVNTLNVSNNNVIRGDGAGVFSTALGSTTNFSNARIMNVTAFSCLGRAIYAGAGDEICDSDIDHGGDTDVSGPGTVTVNGTSTFRVLSGGTLNLLNGNSITTTMGAPTLVNAGSIIRDTDAGTFTIDGVPVTNTGTINVRTGTLAVSGAAATLNNTGTLDVDASRTLEIVSGASLTNFAAGTLTGGIYDVAGTFRFDTGGTGIDTIAADVTLDGAASAIQNADNSDALANTDTVASAGALTLMNTRSFTSGGDFDNQGVIAINAGSTFEVPSGSQLNNFDNVVTRTLSGGRFEISGSGALQFDAGAAGIDTVDAELILDVPAGSNPVRNSAAGSALTNIDTIGDNGRVQLGSGFDFTTASSFFVAANGELVVGADSIFEVPNIGGNQLVNFGGNVITDGSFEVTGVLRAPGLAVQTIGAAGNPSQITLDSQLFDNANMPVPHFQDNANGNSDAFAALATIETGSSLTLSNGAMLATVGSLTVRGRLSVTGSGPGLLRGAPLPSTITIGGDLDQPSGALEVGAAVVNIGGDFLLADGAMLAGTGDVNFVALARGTPGSLVWDGTIAPGAITGDTTGALNIDGSASISETGVFAIGLGGRDPGLTFDQLLLTGVADLNGPAAIGANLGELRVSLVDGFSPIVGDAFEVMFFGSREGEFDQYTGMELPGGLRLEAIWSPDRLTLVVVAPTPGAAVMGVLAMGWASRRRRRRVER